MERPQHDDGGPPPARVLGGRPERRDLRQPAQERQDRLPQHPRALAVHDPDLQDAALAAGGQVIDHQIPDLVRLKRVQVEHAVDRKIDGSRIIRLPAVVAHARSSGNTTTASPPLSPAGRALLSWVAPAERAMRIDLFKMERTQCLYENEVEHNLSESGVLPMQVRELLDGSPDPGWLGEARLKYPASRGSELLRDRIALFYGGATRDNVMVTNGGSEANYVCLWGLLEKGDRAAVMIPNYLQAWGLARAYGGRADAFRLVERRAGGGARWALDTRSLERAVTHR